MRRIKKLGDPPIGTIGQQNSLDVTQRADGAIEVKFTAGRRSTRLQAMRWPRSMEAVQPAG